MIDPRAASRIRESLTSPVAFSQTWLPKRALRSYQAGPVESVAHAVAHRDGEHYVWYFSRQSGKDESVAQLIAYLLTRYQHAGGSIIVLAPTQLPQAAITRDRLVAILQESTLTRRHVTVSDGFTVSIGKASARFLSIEGNVRGQTASLLLIGNEAQDIEPDSWDPKAGPMTASTNAPTLFVGTAWEADSLIGRERRYAIARQRQDDRQRLWLVTWEKVAAEVPAYGDHYRQRAAQLGDSHPFIRSEYHLEEIDDNLRLFDAPRLAQLEGTHQRIRRPIDSEAYAGLVDVAGSDESSDPSQLLRTRTETRRDSTVLTIVRLITDGPRPRFETVDRRAWVNHPLSQLNDQLADLSRLWHLRFLVVDATGIGQGTASFLARAVPPGTTVEPFVFTAKSKSDLGWNLISLIDTGRLKEYARDDEPDTLELYRQLHNIEHEVLPGPGRLLRWSVPEANGHDDLVMSLAMTAHLDTLDLSPRIARGSRTPAR